jgi:predicted  nucleic acid-binding Zn-ribbon protein
VDALEDEIDRLTDAFERLEIPFPRTNENIARFEARLDELRKKQRAAHGELEKCRAANPLPDD